MTVFPPPTLSTGLFLHVVSLSGGFERPLSLPLILDSSVIQAAYIPG